MKKNDDELKNRVLGKEDLMDSPCSSRAVETWDKQTVKLSYYQRPSSAKRAISDKPGVFDEQGFSLIDVLVAVVLFVLGVLAFSSFLGRVMDRNSGNEMMSVAVGLAEERIEELKTKAKDGTIGDADDTTVAISVEGIPYSVVTDVSNGGVGNLVDVNVVVTWTDNLLNTYTLNTRIHQN